MEEKINIAKILNDKKNGLRLYSPIFGECTFCYVRENTNNICVKKYNGEIAFFDSKGLYYNTGEVMLFPSKEMRDWRKFAWKKGDVLVSNDYGTEVIFDKWYDDTYTNFYCKHYLNSEDKNNIKYNDAFLCTTRRYSLEDKDAAQTYINTIEERLGGKLNRETLEIEKQPEFKNGDILFCGSNCPFIFKGETNTGYLYYAGIGEGRSLCISTGNIFCKKVEKIRYATKAEKLQLFDSLAKEDKYWDAEKKQIVDLKPKWITLKPFDKVLVRDGKDEIWEPAFFFRNRPELNVYKYQTVGGKLRVYCIPYNEETAELIGTTNNWKGFKGSYF